MGQKKRYTPQIAVENNQKKKKSEKKPTIKDISMVIIQKEE